MLNFVLNEKQNLLALLCFLTMSVMENQQEESVFLFSQFIYSPLYYQMSEKKKT